MIGRYNAENSIATIYQGVTMFFVTPFFMRCNTFVTQTSKFLCLNPSSFISSLILQTQFILHFKNGKDSFDASELSVTI